MTADGLPPLMPGGESTSAQLRRAERERDDLVAFLRGTQEMAKDRNQGQEPDALHVAYERELARLRAENDGLRGQLAAVLKDREAMQAERDELAAHAKALTKELADANAAREQAVRPYAVQVLQLSADLTEALDELEQLHAATASNDKEKST